MLKLTEAAKYFICNAIFGKPVTVIHFSFNNSTLKIGVIPLFNMPINFILKADQRVYMKKNKYLLPSLHHRSLLSSPLELVH